MTKLGKNKAEKAKPPTIKKETLKDLDPKRQSEGVRGGAYNTQYCEGGGNTRGEI